MVNIRIAAVLAVAISTSSVIFYTLFFGVKAADIVTIGFAPIALAVLFSSVRLVIQGLRFRTLVDSLSLKLRNRPSVKETVIVRMASEFVSLISPTYIGGEAVRIAWLNRLGVDWGNAVWIGYLEVYVDATSTALVIYLSAGYLFFKGATILAALVTAIATTTLVFFTTVTWLSIHGKVRLPSIFRIIILRVLGQNRGASIVNSFEGLLRSYGEAASRSMARFSKRFLIEVTVYTILMILLSGAILEILRTPQFTLNGLIASTAASYVSLVAGAVPFTLGGSGVSELALSAFYSTVWGKADWPVILTWRVVSYHLPLLIGGISLITVVYRETSRNTSKNLKKDYVV